MNDELSKKIINVLNYANRIGDFDAVMVLSTLMAARSINMETLMAERVKHFADHMLLPKAEYLEKVKKEKERLEKKENEKKYN